jgi:hypothetical protein
MSKYEREIEEILRKLDDGRPPTMSERARPQANRKPTPIRPRTQMSLRPEVGILAGILIAFAAQTVRWIAQPAPNTMMDMGIGAAALLGFAIIVLTLVLHWTGGNRGAATGWRGAPLDRQGGGPMNGLKSRWNLLRMRTSYRRRDR